jgi:hypothetical protein
MPETLRCPSCDSANLKRGEGNNYCLDCGFFPIPHTILELGWFVSANMECLALDIMAGQDPVLTLESEADYGKFMQVMMGQAAHFSWSLLAGREGEDRVEGAWVLSARFLFDGHELTIERRGEDDHVTLRDEAAFQRFIRTLEKVARELEWVPAPSPWTSVETAMPERGEAVLTWAPDAYEKVLVRSLSSSGQFWRGRGGLLAVKAGYVTHWQPPPAGPIEKGEKDADD